MFCLLIFIPLFCVMILNLPFGRFARFRTNAAFWIILTLSTLEFLFGVYYQIHIHDKTQAVCASFYGFISTVDSIHLIMFISIGLVSVVPLFTGDYILRDEKARFNFQNLMLISLAGMNGVVLSSDIFSIYMFTEIAAISSYILIALDKERRGLPEPYFTSSIIPCSSRFSTSMRRLWSIRRVRGI